MTTSCLVGEIQSLLASDIDPYQRERATLALAQAQLADGSIDQALASYEELETTTTRIEFLISHAKRLVADGDNAHALERLREANALSTEGRSDLDRLNTTQHSQSIAETFAQAGAGEEGRAVLDGIASYRNRIPMNPMLLALMVQIAEAQADIGLRDEAATVLKETYALALDREIEMTPELVLRIFEAWASIDETQATAAAEDLAAIVGEGGPSAFEFAVWTGLSSGLIASGGDAAAFIERARASLADAPERAAALLFVPKLADVVRESGDDGQARALLNQAREEAAALASSTEKATVALALAEGFARAEAPQEATELLNDILALADSEQGAADMLLRHFVSMVPAQLASLGSVDAAYDLAMKGEDGRRDMSLMTAADKLAAQGKYRDAMRFVREIESVIAVMMMAGIADRLAYASND